MVYYYLCAHTQPHVHNRYIEYGARRRWVCVFDLASSLDRQPKKTSSASPSEKNTHSIIYAQFKSISFSSSYYCILYQEFILCLFKSIVVVFSLWHRLYVKYEKIEFMQDIIILFWKITIVSGHIHWNYLYKPVAFEKLS